MPLQISNTWVHNFEIFWYLNDQLKIMTLKWASFRSYDTQMVEKSYGGQVSIVQKLCHIS